MIDEVEKTEILCKPVIGEEAEIGNFVSFMFGVSWYWVALLTKAFYNLFFYVCALLNADAQFMRTMK